MLRVPNGMQIPVSPRFALRLGSDAPPRSCGRTPFCQQTSGLHVGGGQGKHLNLEISVLLTKGSNFGLWIHRRVEM
ncbi:hypothetical protein EYF80_054897 [Liparis tanakae]|uniref:Uncharacterized protein n=1 Tax=Liparis tanakae TaxID=230148 RepID=A0A4Z2F154_9TELE|nr:hypothetical protein EYF80_054897 [Liparis tanakae]